VISTQPPSFVVDHPRHLSLFFHHNRIFYDLAESALASGLVPAEHHRVATEAVRAIDQDALSRVSYVLAGSETVQGRLVEFNRRSERVGIFHAGPSLEPSSGPNALQADRRLALCLSRHAFPKRTELFVHAMHLAPEIVGVSVGAGGRLGYLRLLDQRLSEHGAPETLDPRDTWLNSPEWIDPAGFPSAISNVEFRTEIDDDELRALFASAFCLVAPALDEDYGLTAIEAMQHGVPVITCTDSGHLTAFVEDGVTGLVVEPTGAAIAAAVRQLAGAPELVDEMAEHCRRQASSFTWQRALSEFDDGLEAVLC
jgi:glycosyltransferase involved in cell wall biosynthesis